MRMLPVALGVLVGVAVTLAVGSVRDRSPAIAGSVRSARPAATAATLEPASDAYRYRFEVTRAADASANIRELEARARAIGATPDDFNDLAALYLQRAQAGGGPDDFAHAEAMARKSLAILPAPNGANLTLAKLAAARHDFRAAIAMARAQPPQAGAYGVLATAHLALGELPDAIAAAERAVALAPGPGSYVMRALVLQAQGRDAEAAFDFTRAVATEDFGDPREAARTRALWARFLLRRNAPTSAGAVLAEALRVSPEDPLALAQRGELELRTGKLVDARASFQRAFALSCQVRYLLDLARAQDVAGDAAAAGHTRAQVEKLIRADLTGSAADAYGHTLDLVELLLDRGAPADVSEALPLATAEVARRGSPETRFQLARALAVTGAPDAAMQEIRMILATGLRDARVYELAARLERGPRAALYAREATRLDPGGSRWRTLGLPAVAAP